MHHQRLALWGQVDFFQTFGLDDDGHLALATIGFETNGARDLRENRGVFRNPCFEDFGHAGQTTDDISTLGDILRLAGDHLSGLDRVAFFDFEAGLGGQVVEVQHLAVAVHDQNLWRPVAAVFGHHDLDLVATLVFANRGADFDVFELHGTAAFGQDGRSVGVPLAEDRTFLHLVARREHDGGSVRHLVLLELATLGIDDGQLTILLDADALFATIGQGDDLLTALTQFNHTGLTCFVGGLDKTLRSNTTGVEGTHGELGARFTNGLGGNRADGEAFFDQAIVRHVHAVALGTHTTRGVTGEHRTHEDLINTQGFDGSRNLGRDQFVLLDHNLIGHGVHDGVESGSTRDGFRQRNINLFALVDGFLQDAARRATVKLVDHRGLSHVVQLPGHVTRVCGLERCIGQSLASTVGGGEVLQHIEAFTEVGSDGGFDDFTRRLGHQSPHASELLHLGTVAPCTGIKEDEQWVQVGRTVGRVHLNFVARGGIPTVVFHVLHQGLGHFLTAVRPHIENVGVAFAVGDGTGIGLHFDAVDLLLRGGEEVFLLVRNTHVGDRDRKTRQGGKSEADFFHLVEQFDGGGLAQTLKRIGNHLAATLLSEGAVVIRHAWAQTFAEQGSPHRGSDAPVVGQRRSRTSLLVDDFVVPLQANVNGLTQVNLTVFPGIDRFGDVAETATAQALLRGIGIAGIEVLGHMGEEVHPHHHVLRRGHDGLAVRGGEDVVGGQHQHVRFGLGFDRQRQVDRHLVAIEVRVVAGAHQGVQSDGVAFHKHRFEGLNTHAVQGGRTIQQHRMLVNDFFQDVPNLWVATLEHALRALDGVSESTLFELANDEGLVELESNLLGKTALPKLQIRTHHDDRTSGVVHPLAEQVLTEATLLAFDHVRDGLEGAVR